MSRNHTLTKRERIKKKSDFKILFSNSQSVSCRGARLFYKGNKLGFNRMGVTLRRKYGNAVQRNYARRLIKEIYRLEKGKIKGHSDLLFILYPGEYGFSERKSQYFSLLKSAGLID